MEACQNCQSLQGQCSGPELCQRIMTRTRPKHYRDVPVLSSTRIWGHFSTGRSSTRLPDARRVPQLPMPPFISPDRLLSEAAVDQGCAMDAAVIVPVASNNDSTRTICEAHWSRSRRIVLDLPPPTFFVSVHCTGL